MIGAIIGDIVGSTREFDPIKTKDFVLIPAGSDYTDDSLMTIAVARAFNASIDGESRNLQKLEALLPVLMREIGRRFPYPKGAYGGRFARWLRSDDEGPYNSWGNGAAMRVSAAGELARTLDDALVFAEYSAKTTHGHPEGIKGAQATAIYLARHGASKDDIRAAIDADFYPVDRTLDEIRPTYAFDESCRGTVHESLITFLESTDYVDAPRNAVSLGGDADTMGAITGSVAWSYYAANGEVSDEMRELAEKAISLLPADLGAYVIEYEKRLTTPAI